MADMKIPPGGSTPAIRPAGAPARSEAARLAQRAFFEAALRGEAAKPQPQPSAARPADSSQLQRPLRPGSLLDIKV